jgi:hypothetical protein
VAFAINSLSNTAFMALISGIGPEGWFQRHFAELLARDEAELAIMEEVRAAAERFAQRTTGEEIDWQFLGSLRERCMALLSELSSAFIAEDQDTRKTAEAKQRRL